MKSLKTLNMDTSKEIFTLDKDKITFTINVNKFSSNSEINTEERQPMGEDNLLITNLTESYLAFRTKLTKVQYYLVEPTYCVIPPKGTQNIHIKLYLRPGKMPDFKEHKFQFNGFIIHEEEKDQNLKDLFNSYIEKGEKVLGNVKKYKVEIIEEREVKPRENENTIELKEPLNEEVTEEKKLQKPKLNILALFLMIIIILVILFLGCYYTYYQYNRMEAINSKGQEIKDVKK